MKDQRELHTAAIKHLDAVAKIIDQLKQAGDHPLDGDNALRNIQERTVSLAKRCGTGFYFTLVRQEI